jgi:PAS domain S-box-containing protein
MLRFCSHASIPTPSPPERKHAEFQSFYEAQVVRRKPDAIWSFAIAVLSVAAALIVSRAPSFHLQSAPVSLFLCAVMVSAWVGGLLPGLIATLLSCLLFSYYFLAPTSSFSVNADEIPRGVLFLLSALFVALLTAAQRRATESLMHTRDDLKRTVQQLQKANDALQAESDERKDAEKKLRESQSYLAEAQKMSHTGTWARIASTGQMRYWSEECYRVMGFEPHDGPAQFETFLERVHPDDRATVRYIAERALREKIPYEHDYRIVHPDGNIRNIHTIGHPVLSPSGDIVEFVGTVMDVTDRRQAERERERWRQALENLAHVNRVTMMGELTASLAHEVNQPIAAAITDAKTCIRWLMRDHPDLEEAREAASRTVKDATRAGEIINRVRLIFKRGTSPWEPVDVNETIREMVTLLSNEATRHSVSIRTELAEELPHVVGDRVQLQQVMMNLMINGVDAMKEVEVARILTIRSQRAEDGQLVVSVSDTGVGLPAEEAGKIFDPFFTTKLDGTGMGLRISRSIIESHGGRLWADKPSPQGASFYFTLPIISGAHA